MPRKAIMGDILAIAFNGVQRLMNLGEKCESDDTVLRYDQPLSNLSYHYDNQEHPILHPNGTKAYVNNGGATPWFKVINLISGTYQANPATLPTAYCPNFALSPDNLELAVACNASPYLFRYDEATMILKSPPASLPGPNIYKMAYSPDGQFLAVGGRNAPYLVVYQTATMTPVTLGTLPGVSDNIQYVDFSPNGAYFAATGENGACYIYNTTTWARITTSAKPYNSRIRSCFFSPDSEKLLFLNDTTYLGVTFMIYTISTNTWKSQPMTSYPNNMGNGIQSARWASKDDIILLATNTSGFYTAGIWKYNNPSSTFEPLSRFYFPLSGFGYMPMTYRKLAGTVKGPGPSFTPLQRTVRAFDRDTNVKVGETVSDASGAFDMRVYTNQPCTVVAIGSGNEVTKLYDSVIPAPLP